MDLNPILAIVLPVVGTSAAVMGFVYRLGKKVGSMETSMNASVQILSDRCDALTKELNSANGQFSSVADKFGEVGERLAHIEGKLGIKVYPKVRKARK